MNALQSWLIILVICVVIELFTMGLTTIWFAVGAVATSILVALFPDCPFIVQFLLFAAVSLVILLTVRPIAVRYFNKDRARTNIEEMIGRQAIVTDEIDNTLGCGQVRVGHMDWSARSVYPGIVIPVGSVVIIRAVDGVKLLVEPESGRKGE